MTAFAVEVPYDRSRAREVLPVLGYRHARGQRNVERPAGSVAHAGLISGAGAGVMGRLMQRQIEHGPIGVERILSAVPVVNVPVDNKHTLGAAAQHCKSDFTSFEGKEVLGKPVLSMQRGDILLDGDELKRSAGKAKFLPGNSDLAAYSPNGHAVE